jgi:hypothetical protein
MEHVLKTKSEFEPRLGSLYEADIVRRGTLTTPDNITDVGSFRPRRVIDASSDASVRGHFRKGVSNQWRGDPHHSIYGQLGTSDARNAQQQNLERKQVFSLLAESLRLQPNIELLLGPAIEVLAEGKRRLKGFEKISERVYAIIREQLKPYQTQATVKVRPAWSHEYEDFSSVVIDIEIVGNDDRRFLLWDSISTKIEGLNTSQDERSFLENNVSVNVITRD